MILREVSSYSEGEKKWPCSSVVEQYPEKVCVVCAIQTKATTLKGNVSSLKSILPTIFLPF